jgi:hypothetical protein
LNASDTPAVSLISLAGTIPVRTATTAMYSTVQTTSDPMIPIGMSRRGFLASSAWVLTASNPMYAKKMMAAPAIIPTGSPWRSFRQPRGGRRTTPPVHPNGANGSQLAGFT